MIHVLSKETIDKIAAGEVAERPESVVKELLDNAIDAGADAVSVEIRGGGLELIRVTDNGCGIPMKEIPTAFIRHATSKLMTAEDIEHIRTMGFRGEALASIAAVSDTELISRTAEEMTGLQYRISEGVERSSREVGAPVGTTVIVRDFLANIPVRRQFLKSAAVENSYVIDTVEKAALAHPSISISLTVDGRSMLHTSGNGKLKDVIYLIYGQEAAANLIEVDSGAYAAGVDGTDLAAAYTDGSKRYPDAVIDSIFRKEQKNVDGKLTGGGNTSSVAKAVERMSGYLMSPAQKQALGERRQAAGRIRVTGYAAKPVIARSKRDFEVFFVNGRAIRSEVLRKAAEDAYAPFLMMHRFPMVVLNVELAPEDVDVNVHPRKVEVRFADSRAVYDAVRSALNEALVRQEHVVDGARALDKPQKPVRSAFQADPYGKDPQPFEKSRRFDYVSDIETELKKSAAVQQVNAAGTVSAAPSAHQDITVPAPSARQDIPAAAPVKAGEDQSAAVSHELPEPHPVEEIKKADPAPAVSDPNRRKREDADSFINAANAPQFKMIGQIFETYWIIEFHDEMYLIDQHAAHEKVNYERFTRLIRDHAVSSQMLFPPLVLTLSAKESALMEKNLGSFEEAGYEIEAAGDRDYVVRAVPSNLPGLGEEELLMDLIESMSEETRGISSEDMKYKIASMSCKAAVKGSRPLSELEMRALISELLTLDNPYMCPHGRPTIARWTKTEIDKIFKRIV